MAVLIDEIEIEIDMEGKGCKLSLKKKYKEYKKENCGYALLPLCHGFLLIYIHIKRAKSYKAPEMKKVFFFTIRAQNLFY